MTTGAVIFVLCLLAGVLVYFVSTDKGGGGKKTFIAKVDLVKPNLPDKPPPSPKEKLPEPEVQKQQQTIVAPQDMMKQAGPKGDDKPAADGPLGVEGEGGAGSDGFGLVGRGKGGRDITTIGGGGSGGGLDQAGLLRRFGRYNQIVQEEISTALRKWLRENGGVPRGKLEAMIQIVFDDSGTITQVKITRSCGNHAVDEAVKRVCSSRRMSEPLPKDMPRTINIRITSQG